jgi:hypothetical protein
MVQTIATNHTGHPRRSLNDSIGRLDAMIDGLSDAIPQTIADTLEASVSGAIAKGVHAALMELCRSPELLHSMRDALGASAPVVAQPLAPRQELLSRLWANIKAGAARVAEWCSTSFSAVAQVVATGAQAAVKRVVSLRKRMVALCQYALLLRRVRNALLLSAAVGGLATFLALIAPQWVAASLSGLAGTTMTLAIQGWIWLRRHWEVLLTAD